MRVLAFREPDEFLLVKDDWTAESYDLGLLVRNAKAWETPVLSALSRGYWEPSDANADEILRMVAVVVRAPRDHARPESHRITEV